MGYAVDVERLCVTYRQKSGAQVRAVQDLTFTVSRGEIVGFLGPNGAGKSSTLKALMGFVTPVSGRADVFGLKAGSVESRRTIGYLPEVAMYYPFLTPLETLQMYGELQGLRGKALKEDSKTLLEAVGLGSVMGKLNRSLSKGMLQRVGIAQSLLGKPELLILDEVTSGLDPIGRKELRDLLHQRQREGCTLFFSSHELAEVEMLCDRILLMHKGQLVEERSIEDLKNELRSFSLTVLGDVPLHDLAAWTEPLEPGVVKAHFDTKLQLLQAIERVRESTCTVLDVVAQEGSLEKYFIDTIQRAA